ncbi:MAG: alpha/beta hydrolase [Clostridia bacterium]|nr:alpha/beta hydrolase [Clostridia bacterium]
MFALRETPSFCLTAVDFYGFGESPAPSVPVDLQYFADGVDEVMRRYNMEDVVVVAHSFGARVAVRLATQSTRIAGLVLVGAAGMKPRRTARYYLRIARAKWYALWGLPRPQGSADYEATSGAERRTFVNIIHTYQEKEVREIRVPVLLVWGTADRETPPYMLRRYERLLRNSRTVLFEGRGHFCFAEEPQRFDAIVKEFALCTTAGENPSAECGEIRGNASGKIRSAAREKSALTASGRNLPAAGGGRPDGANDHSLHEGRGANGEEGES